MLQRKKFRGEDCGNCNERKPYPLLVMFGVGSSSLYHGAILTVGGTYKNQKVKVTMDICFFKISKLELARVIESKRLLY